MYIGGNQATYICSLKIKIMAKKIMRVTKKAKLDKRTTAGRAVNSKNLKKKG